MIAVADELGATPSQVATGVGARSAVAAASRSSAPARRRSCATTSARSSVELPEEALERLSAVSGFQLGFPRDFLESEHVRGLIFGDTFDLIDDHRARRPARRPAAVA